MSDPGREMDLDPDGGGSIREGIRTAFGVPEATLVRLHRSGRPAWFLEMSWNGDETVAFGDRFFSAPGVDGFSLVAILSGRPVGYLSAELSPDTNGGGTAHIWMIQVDADFRARRIGSALVAGLAEILVRDMNRRVSAGLPPAPWRVSADSQPEAAARLVARLERVLDVGVGGDLDIEKPV